MKNLGWILAGISAGVLFYLYKNPQQGSFASGPRDVDDAASSVGNWGTKQRLSGAGSGIVGKVKEGFGRVTGDDQTAGEGVLDQVAGTVKDVVGQGAEAVSKTTHDLTK